MLYKHSWGKHKYIYIYIFLLSFFRATPKAYGGSQARERQLAYKTVTATWDPNHICDPKPQLTAGSSTHWARPGTEPVSSWMLVRFVNRWTTTGIPKNINILKPQISSNVSDSFCIMFIHSFICSMIYLFLYIMMTVVHMDFENTYIWGNRVISCKKYVNLQTFHYSIGYFI